MKAWWLFAALAAALTVSGCGSDECKSGACNLQSDCRTICDRAFACIQERAGEELPTEIMDGCVENCVVEHAAGPLAICRDCVTSVSCDQAERCFDSNVCETTRYDLQVDGSGFDVWDGAAVHVAVMEVDGDFFSHENTGRSTIDGGEFTLTMPAVLRSGEPSALDVLVDVDGNDACDEDDFVFRQAVPTVTGPVAIDVEPPATETAEACDWFDTIASPRLFVEGSGFAGSNGRWIILGLIDEPTPAFEREYQITRIEGGRFEARFDWVYGDPEARIAWMIDDGDWSCASSDIGGFAPVGTIDAGDRRITITPADVAPGFCADLPAYGK